MCLDPGGGKDRYKLMSSRFFKIRPTFALVCVLALLHPILIQAITNDGYRGNTIGGRPSIAIVDAPGGTKVNTLLGNLFLSRSDLRIPGRGLPIELQFAYNSNQNGIASPFGSGWTFNYGMRCLLSASRNVVVEWADGRSDLYQYKAGVYTPYNASVFASLALVGGSLQLTTKEQIRFFFDTSRGLLQRIQDPNGNALTFTNTGTQLTTITDASGRSISLTYDANGRVTQITDPNASPARILRYAYDANGNQTGFTDPLGNVTTYSYDTGHRLIQVTDPLGITRISYGLPNMTVATVSRSTLTNTVLSTRSFSYNVPALTTTVTDQLDNSTSASTGYQYDAHFRLAKTTDPLGHVEARTYDSHGNIASVTDPNGNTTTYTYDAEGNILSITDALGHVTEFTYNALYNKVASMTDANGHSTTYTYDSRGNLATRQDALGNVTRYSYDAAGQLVSRQNPRGFSTAFRYDSFGDQTGITDPLGRSRTFVYDSVGNRLSRTDGNNHTTHYSYDARNRMVAVVYPDASQAAFTYDPDDKVLTATDPNTDLRLVYDADERTAQVADNRLAKTISYQYDGVGNRVQMIDPEGTITSYGYDRASRLAMIARSSQQFNFSYDNADRLTNSHLPNGSSTGYVYDNANRLLSMVNQKSDNSVISSFGYQYDNAGNRVSMTLAGGEIVNYDYDGNNQLVREIRGGATAYDHQFSYDPVGNRMQLNASSLITSYAYDNADELTQEMKGANGTVYQYDGNGNRVRKIAGAATSTYSYDFNSRLVGFASSASSASYAIDALGRRVSKTVNGSTARFFYDGQDAVAEYDGGGSLQAQNLFGLGTDRNLARFGGGSSLYYLHDGLNSVRNILDPTQTVQNSYDYDAWGNISSVVENVANRYTFTGRESDSESGLYHYRARAYDSSNGRFTQMDPIDFNLGRSAYTYVDDNPVNTTDPLGLWSWSGILAAAAAVLDIIVAVAVILTTTATVALVVAVVAAVAGVIWLYSTIAGELESYRDKYQDQIERSIRGSPSASNGAGCTGVDGSYAQGSMAV
jgi:RHS repeat-associated protein